MKKYALFVLLAFGSLGSCKSPVEPEPLDLTPAGKREYVWSIDSIDYEGRPGIIEINSMWGSSATDVWGANGDAGDVRNCLWHYDGKVWRRATQGTPITEYTGNKVVYAVWGSAQNDVWAAGRKINQGVTSIFLMHYDGARWTDATPPQVRAIDAVMYSVHGIGKNDLWFYGYEYIIHYDGKEWQPYKVADSVIVDVMGCETNNLYMATYSPWIGNIAQGTRDLYRKVNNNIFLAYRTPFYDWPFGGEFWRVKDKVMAMRNDGVISISILSDGNLDPNNIKQEFPISIGGRFIQSSKNIFALGVYNSLYHYNGTDWKQLLIPVLQPPKYGYDFFTVVWADGNEVFTCDSEKGIIYHGR